MHKNTEKSPGRSRDTSKRTVQRPDAKVKAMVSRSFSGVCLPFVEPMTLVTGAWCPDSVNSRKLLSLVPPDRKLVFVTKSDIQDKEPALDPTTFTCVVSDVPEKLPGYVLRVVVFTYEGNYIYPCD